MFFLVALLTLLQSITYVVVRQANRRHALRQIESSLRSGGQIFRKLIDQRNRQITTAASILSRDHAFLEAFAGTGEDRATTLSALESLRSRIDADRILIASLEKQTLFDTGKPDAHSGEFAFPKLIDKAESEGAAYAFGILEGELYAVAVTPLLAPAPIAWLCPAFQIDDEFAREIKIYSNLEITFADLSAGEKLFASTLMPDKQNSRRDVLHGRLPQLKEPTNVKIGGEHLITYVLPLPTQSGTIIAVLQRSLDAELAPYLTVERTYLGLALIGLLLSLGIGIAIAGTVSRPILELAEGTRKISAGDYTGRLAVRSNDEIGLLATAFNQMSGGLAERDQVRDLLGKVVSPAVATELLRGDVKLGGEEREVTVLFSDLRSFTSMCEGRPPQEMLGILNHYFTRMSGIVEKHDGIVDKYVGDAMMALFGAPLASSDGADQAMQTALEMMDALHDLNRQWQAEGRRPLGMGIGINTDVVVAGNMGSQTRLNYTVIGDGVNLASRLETLTKTPEYDARIIVSGATLRKAKGRYRTRALGQVAVKGKQEPTDIYALLALEIAAGDAAATTVNPG